MIDLSDMASTVSNGTLLLSHGGPCGLRRISKTDPEVHATSCPYAKIRNVAQENLCLDSILDEKCEVLEYVTVGLSV